MLVGLLEVPRNDTRTKREPPFVRDVLAREQAQEVALARAVVAEQCDALAEGHLEVKGQHQPRDGELGAREHTHAGATAAQADAHVLAARPLGGWAGLLELPQSR